MYVCISRRNHPPVDQPTHQPTRIGTDFLNPVSQPQIQPHIPTQDERHGILPDRRLPMRVHRRGAAQRREQGTGVLWVWVLGFRLSWLSVFDVSTFDITPHATQHYFTTFDVQGMKASLRPHTHPRVSHQASRPPTYTPPSHPTHQPQHTTNPSPTPHQPHLTTTVPSHTHHQPQ